VEVGAWDPVVEVIDVMNRLAESPLADSQPRPFADGHAVYAVRSPDGTWFGPDDRLPGGRFGTGWLAFDPPNAPGGKFAGEELLVRCGS
jgi:hypothetical protein